MSAGAARSKAYSQSFASHILSFLEALDMPRPEPVSAASAPMSVHSLWATARQVVTPASSRSSIYDVWSFRKPIPESGGDASIPFGDKWKCIFSPSTLAVSTRILPWVTCNLISKIASLTRTLLPSMSINSGAPPFLTSPIVYGARHQALAWRPHLDTATVRMIWALAAATSSPYSTRVGVTKSMLQVLSLLIESSGSFSKACPRLMWALPTSTHRMTHFHAACCGKH